MVKLPFSYEINKKKFKLIGWYAKNFYSARLEIQQEGSDYTIVLSKEKSIELLDKLNLEICHIPFGNCGTLTADPEEQFLVKRVLQYEEKIASSLYELIRTVENYNVDLEGAGLPSIDVKELSNLEKLLDYVYQKRLIFDFITAKQKTKIKVKFKLLTDIIE